jgi:chromosomal replication initiation ATPase DnaA
MFAFALSWSVAGSIDDKYHSRYETYLSTEFSMTDLPKGSIYDYHLVGQGKEPPSYEPWPIKEFEYNPEKSYFELVVETKDTVRFSWFVKQNLKQKNPLFFTGMTGVGKSIIISSAIAEMKSKGDVEEIFMSFSSQTSANEVQIQLEEKLEKRRK